MKKHKYKKTGNEIFFCVQPDCYFKIEAHLMLGKKSLCNICGCEFVMGEYAVKLHRPHCQDCGKVKVKDADGKNRYIRKIANRAVANVAIDVGHNLRSRLDNAVKDDLEHDI